MDRFNKYLEDNKKETSYKLRKAEEETKKKQEKLSELKKIGRFIRRNQEDQNHHQHQTARKIRRSLYLQKVSGQSKL